MKFLVTNDDGIDAPGIAALASMAATLGEVIVVAPRDGQSNCGHATTTHAPLRVTRLGPHRYAVAGTPADCVRIALKELASEVDWVLSGINYGGNLGVDVYMSGTVAAAREAMLLAYRSVAFSQFRRHPEFTTWDEAGERARVTLLELMELPHEPFTFWNVNFPDERTATVPPREMCPLEPQPLAYTFTRVDEDYLYRSNYQQRPRSPGSDVAVCFAGNISVSRITHGTT